MPVHRRSPTANSGGCGEILQDLIKELKNPRPRGQPIIVEDRTPETNSIRVHVIWDRWGQCDRTRRAGIVLAAYEEVFGAETRGQVTLVLGLTVAEAIATGLLPYRIVPARRRGARPADEKYQNVMVKEGAITIASDDWPQLRFATQEDAEITLEHLMQTLPDSKWIIIQEVEDASTSTSVVTSTSVSLRPDR
jgi:hypothetical protein